MFCRYICFSLAFTLLRHFRCRFFSINQHWTCGMKKLSVRLGYSNISFIHVLILFSFCKIQNGIHPKMYVVCTSNTKVVVFVFRKAVVLWTLAPHLHGTAPEEKAKAEKKTVWSSQGVTQGFYILKVHSNGFCENTFVLSLAGSYMASKNTVNRILIWIFKMCWKL